MATDKKDGQRIVSSKSSWQPNIVARWFMRVVIMLPMPVLAMLGRGLGTLFYVFDKKRGHYADINLRICFPELDNKAIKRLRLAHFRALGQSLMCTLGLTWFRPKARLQKYLTIEGEENIIEQQKAGNNIIIMAPHFVGLELAWAWLSMTQPMVGMYREPRKNIFHWAIDLRRTQFGGIAVEAQAHMKSLIKMIRDGKPFFYLPDIDPGKTGRYTFAPFFGRPAATWTALGRIGTMTKASIIPCIVRQDESGHYTIQFLPALSDYPSGNELEDATALNQLVETAIRKMPEQYFWIHRRFKTRPEGEASIYGSGRKGYK
ncbi:MAG: lysophospholipid acyltransferase family protein [Proteobacteria bacterium]|nr:lysophospholipid acyltransferase family protein [Pseudomonadota bacterium]